MTPAHPQTQSQSKQTKQNLSLDLNGRRRILFLSDSAELIARQLAGEDLAVAQAGTLRDDVSTDEITPMSVLTQYDERLGRCPYVGFRAEGSCPIGLDAVRNGGFGITVAGNRYGKGSSREHSPLAEWHAGVRLVIARSFERIYRQNADNLGLFTSTDFSLIDRLQRGEDIDIASLLHGRDALAAAILRTGGLLRYGVQMMRHIHDGDDGNGDDRDDAHGDVDQHVDQHVDKQRQATATAPHSAARPSRSAPRTLTDKILARHAIRTEQTSATPAVGEGAFVRADWRFIHEYYTGMATHMLHAAFGKPLKLYAPQSILAFEDHLSYSHRSPLHIRNGLQGNVAALSKAHRDFATEYGVRNHGYLSEDGASTAAEEGSEGISHAMMAETYALPGQLVVGTDSHTPHSGALGCLAFGVGTTDLANAFVTGAVRMTAPSSLLIDMRGRIPAGVTAKDLVLKLLAEPRIRAGAGVGKVFEFAGPAIAQLSTDERTTLTNMTAELGGFSGIVAPDAETVRFLKARRGVDFDIAPWMCSDPGAEYADVIVLECDKVTPMVAKPGDPGNGIFLEALGERPRIDIAYGGSCTAGKREDFDYYYAVLHWADQRGLRVAPHVKLFLQFGTVAVRDYCIDRGYLEVFERVGAEMLQPACGACANCGPGSSTQADEVTISAINRNFAGRSGPGQVWLASPPTVAASAIAGSIASFEELRASTH